ncbi:hypothetical protein GGE50_003854 [Rhizobium leguminosarum]|uniref:hypothetical protein n=1 Tax=Rhizobium leguminosarum TaxID=384 RepID=UPI0016201907|nr:hypothetical protein [Rhizobium leguminosarum]MBB4587950.1 hypothetical protein [Rhizobium leguminosarum]
MVIKKRSRVRDLSGTDPVAHTIVPAAGLPLKVYSPKYSTPRKSEYFNFSRCSGMGEIARLMAAQFIQHVDSMNSVKSARAVMVSVRFWMDAVCQSVAEDGVAPEDWETERWHQVSNGWAYAVENDLSLEETTRATYVSGTWSFVTRLQTSGLIPTFRLRSALRDPAGGRKTAISDIVRSNKTDAAPVDGEYIAAFKALEELSDISDADIYLKRLDYFIDRVVAHCQQAVRKIWRDFSDTKRGLEDSSGLDVLEFLRKWQVSKNPVAFRRGWKGEVQKELDALRLALHFSPSGLLSRNDLPEPVNRLIDSEYSIKRLKSLLHTTPITSVPFLALILVDLMNEVSSSMRLKEGSALRTEDAGTMMIKWIKARAHAEKTAARAIQDISTMALDSDEKISTPTLMMCLDEMRQRLIPYAETQHSDDLFLVGLPSDTTETIGPLSEQAQSKAWHRFRSEDMVLNEFHFTLDKIRSTLVLRAFLVSGGDLFAVQQAAQHSLRTAQRYVDREAGRLVGNNDVRTVQDAMLLDATPNRSELHRRLGVDREKTRASVQAARSIGFLEWATEEPEEADELTSNLVDWLLGSEKVIIDHPVIGAQIFSLREHIKKFPELRLQPSWEMQWAPLLIYLNVVWSEMRPQTRHEAQSLAEEFEIAFLEPTE